MSSTWEELPRESKRPEGSSGNMCEILPPVWFDSIDPREALASRFDFAASSTLSGASDLDTRIGIVSITWLSSRALLTGALGAE